MAGCASAYVLSKNKDLDVHLVEKSILGAGVRTFFTVVTHTHLDQDTF